MDSGRVLDMESLQEKQRIGALLDIYGGLLTDRQRDFLDLYYSEDISYGEIAETENISRQAVHDTISHGKKSLLRFEEHLGLISSKEKPDSSSSLDIDIDELKEQITRLSKLTSVDIAYDMIPIQKQVKRIKDIIGMQ